MAVTFLRTLPTADSFPQLLQRCPSALREWEKPISQKAADSCSRFVVLLPQLLGDLGLRSKPVFSLRGTEIRLEM